MASCVWQGPNTALDLCDGEGDNLKAFPFQNGRMKTGRPGREGSGFRPPKPTCGLHGDLPDNWMPGGTLTVSVTERTPGRGSCGLIGPANGDANSFRGVKGVLMAFNAENVSEELWRSQESIQTPIRPTVSAC